MNIEQLARKLCAADGFDPDETRIVNINAIVSGRLQILPDGRAGDDRRNFERRDVSLPRWELYRTEALRIGKTLSD